MTWYLMYHSMHITIVSSFSTYDNLIIIMRFVDCCICTFSLCIISMISIVCRYSKLTFIIFTIWHCNFRYIFGSFSASSIIFLFHLLWKIILLWYFHNRYVFHLSFYFHLLCIMNYMCLYYGYIFSFQEK